MSDENEEPEASKEHPCDNGTCDCDGPEARECRAETPLTLESMGLVAFHANDALRCPKCGASAEALKKRYHEGVTITLGDGSNPCQEWVAKKLLGGSIGEHLCVRCSGCDYGFPMKCADG
jgi:hypothetical protein